MHSFEKRRTPTGVRPTGVSVARLDAAVNELKASQAFADIDNVRNTPKLAQSSARTPATRTAGAGGDVAPELVV